MRDRGASGCSACGWSRVSASPSLRHITSKHQATSSTFSSCMLRSSVGILACTRQQYRRLIRVDAAARQWSMPLIWVRWGGMRVYDNMAKWIHSSYVEIGAVLSAILDLTRSGFSKISVLQGPTTHQLVKFNLNWPINNSGELLMI